MARLSPEEAAALGLPMPAAPRRLSPEEAASIGLPASPNPAPPGRGELQEAEGRRAITDQALNIPAAMLTPDPATNRMMAEKAWEQGLRAPVKKADVVKASMAILGGAMVPMAGIPAAVVSSGLIGGGTSGGDSPGEIATDTAKGAAAGYGFAKAVPWAFGVLGRFAKGKLAAAADKADDMASKAVEKRLGSLRGSYGQARQEESRAIEVLLRAEATGELTAPQATQLAALKASPEWSATVQNVAQNYMDDMPGMANRATNAKQEFQQFASDLPGALESEKARVLSGGEAKEQIAARLKRYGPMAAAGAMAGHVVGGPFGAILGGAGGAAVRPMLHAVRRAYQHPAVQTAAWTPVEQIAAAMSQHPGAVTGPAAPAVADPMIEMLLRSMGRPRLATVTAEEGP